MAEQVARAADAVPRRSSWSPTGAFHLLFIVANGTPRPVNMDPEERAIRDRVAPGLFQREPDTRAADLFHVLREHQPDVLHFAGTGGSLALWDHADEPTVLAAAELGNHFRSLGRQAIGVSVVVLNRCYDEEQAKAIAPYVDYVLGTSGDDPTTFAVTLYDSLQNGKNVLAAFEAALLRSGMVGAAFYSTPAEARAHAWPGRVVAAALGLAVGVGATLGLSGPTEPGEADLMRSAAISTELRRLRPAIGLKRVVLIKTDLDSGMSSAVAESVATGTPSALASWREREVDDWYLAMVRKLALDGGVRVLATDETEGQIADVYRSQGITGSIVALVLVDGRMAHYISANLDADSIQSANTRTEVEQSVSAIRSILRGRE